MASQYPAQIDTSVSLPTVVDNLTPIAGAVANRLRDAILRIETELGAKPSSTYGNVRNRLDALEEALGSSESGGIIPIGSPQPGQTVIWNGSAWTTSTNFANQDITTTGSIIPKLIKMNASSAPGLSGTGQGIIYFDNTTNQFLTSQNGEAYQPLGTGGGGSFTPAGDLGGSGSSQLVVGLQSRPLANTAPTTGQAILWNGSSWAPSTNFGAQNITTTGNLISGPASTTSLTTGVETLNGKLIINNIPTSSTLSDAAQAIIYYDATANKLKVSENGASYVDLVGGGSSFPSYPVTNVSSLPYTVLSSDSLIAVNTNSSGNVTLEASPTTGRTVIIKDRGGNAYTNNITISGNGKNIDGIASYIISNNYADAVLVYTGFEWSII